jgi:hypothetical protein
MKILHLSYSISKGGASRAALRIHQSLLKKKINSFVKISILNSPKLNIKNVIKPNLLRGYATESFYVRRQFLGVGLYLH